MKGLKLEWSVKLDSEPKALNGLTAPLVRATVATSKGVKDLVVVGGASGKVFVIDGDTGKIVWQKTLSVEGTPQRQESWLCPNALTATPVIGPVPRTEGPGTFGQALYVLASDGKLHIFSLVSGEDILPPTSFVPPFAKMWSMNLVNGLLYTTTSQGCNGVNSGVYAMDLNDADHKTYYFQAGKNGSGIWERGGAALTSDGKILVSTGDGPYDPQKNLIADSVIALSAKDLSLLDYFTPRNRSWMTKKDLDMGCIGPTVFQFKDRELAAASGQGGRHLSAGHQVAGGRRSRHSALSQPAVHQCGGQLRHQGLLGRFLHLGRCCRDALAVRTRLGSADGQCEVYSAAWRHSRR